MALAQSKVHWEKLYALAFKLKSVLQLKLIIMQHLWICFLIRFGLSGSRKGWCSAAATAEPAPLKAELKLLPQQAPCYGKPETFAVLLRAQQFLKALETPQSDCLRSETWKTLLDHDALLCSIMQWSLDTTVDACLKGILFPRDKNLFVKVENFLNGMDHSRRIGIGDAEISPPFMSQKNRLIASNPRNKDFKCCRNCVCRWLRC